LFDEYLLNSFKDLVIKNNLIDQRVICVSRSGEELNLPSNEYALIRGPEILVECTIAGFKGDSFTSYPMSYEGTLGELVNSIDLNNIGWRGVFFAALNALLTKLGIIDGGTHCVSNEPELCGIELADYLLRNFGIHIGVLHIGYHPGHIKALVSRFSKLYVTDLNKDLVDKVKYGLKIIDGFRNRELIGEVDVVLITGSAIVNKTLYNIVKEVYEHGKIGVIYGVTAKGAHAILKKNFREFMNTKYFCPYSAIK